MKRDYWRWVVYICGLTLTVQILRGLINHGLI